MRPVLVLTSLRTLRGFSLALALLALTPSQTAQAATKDLGPELAALKESLKLPGVAAVVMRDGQVVAEGTAGVRRLGTATLIAIEDRFSIGSCTKRLTSYLVARLVDEGKISLDLTLSQAMPDVPMRDDYKAVTLSQLLSFTGGIAGYERVGPQMTPELFVREGSLADRQAGVLRHVLQLPPAAAIGKEARYSNASYMIAALMVSKVMGRSYQDLMSEYVFRPLALKSAGWGRPANADHPGEPWRHVARPDGYVPEPDMLMPPEELFAAAGDAHMTVRELARFAAEDLAVRQAKSPRISAGFAPAWQGINGPQPATKDGKQSYFGGTPWIAACYTVWPERHLVAAMVVNGGTPGDQACKQFIESVDKAFGQT